MQAAYCTNVVAGSTLEDSCAAVERIFGAVAARRGDRRLPVGLWLSAAAARQLSESVGGAPALRDRLAASGLPVVTLNGFPYHDFHGAEVKHRVYEPHWADARRAMHTELLAGLLAELVPPGTRTASVSTLPLGWRASFSTEGCGASVGVACAFLGQLVRALARIEDATGVDAFPVEVTGSNLPPYVVYVRDQTTREQMLPEALGAFPPEAYMPPVATFTVTIYADSYVQAWEIAEDITGSLHNVSEEASGLTIHECLVVDERDGVAGYLEGRESPTYTVEQTITIRWE